MISMIDIKGFLRGSVFLRLIEKGIEALRVVMDSFFIQVIKTGRAVQRFVDFFVIDKDIPVFHFFLSVLGY